MLLEAAPSVGGRIRTVRRSPKGRVDYEGGPWRIHESHHRVLRLVKELGLELEQTSSSKSHIKGGALSVYGRHLIAHGVLRANRMELESGYEGFDAAAEEEHAYARHASGVYYVVKTGFDSMVMELKKRVQCPVRVNTRVTNVRRAAGKYEIEVSMRKGMRFRKKVYQCRRVVFALPPTKRSSGTYADSGCVRKSIR